MNDTVVCEVVLEGKTGQRQTAASKLQVPAGEYQLTLVFIKSNQLEISEIQLS